MTDLQRSNLTQRRKARKGKQSKLCALAPWRERKIASFFGHRADSIARTKLPVMCPPELGYRTVD